MAPKTSSVYISQSRTKPNLVKAFVDAGANVVKDFDSTVKLIVPTVDEELPFMAQIKPFMESKGIKVMVPSDYTVYETRDKAEFYRFCRRHSFPTPETSQFTAIVKPRFGKGSKGLEYLDRSKIVQEYIDWPEYSADYFADWNGKCLSLVQRQRLGVKNGEATQARIVWDADIHNQLLRLGNELGLIGHNVIQYFSDGINFKISEVNTRFGGGSHLTFDIFNSPKWLVSNL